MSPLGRGIAKRVASGRHLDESGVGKGRSQEICAVVFDVRDRVVGVAVGLLVDRHSFFVTIRPDADKVVGIVRVDTAIGLAVALRMHLQVLLL